MRTHPLRSSAGYTLVELVVVLALAALVLSLAVPSMTRFVVATRTQSAIERVSSDLNLARTEAVRSGRTASLQIVGASAYNVVVSDPAAVSGIRTVKRVALDRDFPGVSLTPTAGTVSFNSRGLRSGAGSVTTIVVSSRQGLRSSLQVSPIGRIYRDN